MITKEFLGVYLEKDTLQYCGAVKSVSAWALSLSGTAMAPSGVLQGAYPETLRKFLLELSPRKGRRIFLALPRNRFFVRDVPLPPMPMEDALSSVQSALPMTCHLPLEDIFYDVFLCRIPDGSVNALVVYAPRKEIQPLLDIFRETGHEKSLSGLAPVSLGLGAWLSLHQYAMPMGVMLPAENAGGELAVYQNTGCVFSTAWQGGKNNLEEAAARVALVQTRFHLSQEDIVCLDPAEGAVMVLPDPVKNVLTWLPSIRQNLGVAALCVPLSGQQPVLLNGSPPRLVMFHLWKLFLPVLIGVAAMLAAWTVSVQHRIQHEKDIVSALKKETTQLRQQVQPLEKNRDTLKKMESLFADIDDFVKLRPRLFTCFNEIARLIPDGTWFSRCVFQGTELSLQGQSRDTLKVIEALRTSGLFEQVKLVGSVNRLPSGIEQFNLSIRLKNVDATS